MPRQRSDSRKTLVDNAMRQFWVHGYDGTSVSDLVSVTKVGRSALYSDYNGKKGLFLTCLDAYRDQVVSPSFYMIEDTDVGFEAVRAFIDHQINWMIDLGLPSGGCLMSNTLTELAAHDPEVSRAIIKHFDRLTKGFAKAFGAEIGQPDSTAVNDNFIELARFLTISFQGLAAFARACTDPEILLTQKDMLLDVIELRLNAGRTRQG